MSDTRFFRKYMDYIDEAPATAINPNDPNAAAYGRQINAPTPKPTISSNPRLATINQQVARASNVVNPNAPKGGGYDPSKVQYAYSGGQPTGSQPVATQSPVTEPNLASQYISANQPKPNTVAPTPATPANTSEPSLASQYISANQSQPATIAKSAPAPATEPNLASQYISANQPQAVAEQEADDKSDDILQAIIRLIKK